MDRIKNPKLKEKICSAKEAAALIAPGSTVGVSGFTSAGYPKLVPGALDGRKWMYIPSTAADCCDDTEAAEAFDASFPPREKKWMPSQEEFYIYSHSSVVR